jgi:hypothetical protein
LYALRGSRSTSVSVHVDDGTMQFVGGLPPTPDSNAHRPDSEVPFPPIMAEAPKILFTNFGP